MSDRPRLDQGGTAVGERVNPVRLQAPQLDQNDKTVLCSAVCHCSAAPAISRDGRNLKQVCVAQHLRALDDVLQQRSPYKPEVSYDMTKQPPQPILDMAQQAARPRAASGRVEQPDRQPVMRLSAR
ncbi:hypothetical protein [Pseudomonas parafulva]|uniref:hypothetical protein n=1 Tax=Pseudomonas parafulva TaxID=157782 RepID=UPI0006897027|nr:hypothetical protein [Pseudomonas parafulva]